MAKGTSDRWRSNARALMLTGDTPACWEATMSHLRLVPPVGSAPTGASDDDRPRVSLRLLMAASGRCSCDACLIAFRLGDRTAGIVEQRRPTARLSAVR
jgi:hypothetical protein